MSLTFSRYVRFIFHVCPVLRCADWFPCALVPFHFFCAPLVFISVPFHVPFSSPLFSSPVVFLSCRLPISSSHFLALPCISPLLPSMSRKKIGFSSVFAKRHRVFPDFRQREAGSPSQQKSRQGNRAWDRFATDSPKTTFDGRSLNDRAKLYNIIYIYININCSI